MHWALPGDRLFCFSMLRKKVAQEKRHGTAWDSGENMCNCETFSTTLFENRLMFHSAIFKRTFEKRVKLAQILAVCSTDIDQYGLNFARVLHI